MMPRSTSSSSSPTKTAWCHHTPEATVRQRCVTIANRNLTPECKVARYFTLEFSGGRPSNIEDFFFGPLVDTDRPCIVYESREDRAFFFAKWETLNPLVVYFETTMRGDAETSHFKRFQSFILTCFAGVKSNGGLQCPRGIRQIGVLPPAAAPLSEGGDRLHHLNAWCILNAFERHSQRTAPVIYEYENLRGRRTARHDSYGLCPVSKLGEFYSDVPANVMDSINTWKRTRSQSQVSSSSASATSAGGPTPPTAGGGTTTTAVSVGPVMKEDPVKRIKKKKKAGQVEGVRMHWEDDCIRQNCARCDKQFHWLYRRRHHCRQCGEVVCGQCSGARLPTFIPKCELLLNVRVCTTCATARSQPAFCWKKELTPFFGSTAARNGCLLFLATKPGTFNPIVGAPSLAPPRKSDALIWIRQVTESRRHIRGAEMAGHQISGKKVLHDTPLEEFGDCPICCCDLQDLAGTDDFSLNSRSDGHQGLCFGTDPDAIVTVNTCGHSFHAACIAKWLKSSHKCPLCNCDAFKHVQRLTAPTSGSRRR